MSNRHGGSLLTWSWRSWVVWQWWHLCQRPCLQCQRWLCLWLSAAQWELSQCSPRTCQECRVYSSHPFLWSEWCHWCLLVAESSPRWCWQDVLVWLLGERVWAVRWPEITSNDDDISTYFFNIYPRFKLVIKTERATGWEGAMLK